MKDSGAQENEESQAHEGAEGFPLEDLTSAYLIRWFIATLAAKAWECLGLVANPLKQEIKTDLEQARVAIDAVAALIPVIEGDMEDDEASRLKSLLRDLRVNFVEKNRGS